MNRGRIVSISKSPSLPKADVKKDLKGMLLLPGVIDEHVHFRDPGMTYKEDFLTGTKAAAAGGVTTVFDMPNTIPLVSTKKILLDKIFAIKSKAHVDYCLYGALIEDNIGELAGMAKAGAVGFKVFLAEVTGGSPRPSNGYILEAFRAVADLGLTVAAHAEDSNITQYFMDKLKVSTRDPSAYCKARPPIAEAEGIQLLTLLGSEAGSRIHFVHTSSNAGLIKAAKRRGIKVTAETCPQYLFFTEEDMKTKGALLKINPPPRNKNIVREMREAVRNGIIDTVASDHAPHSLEEKERDIWEAPAGIAGVETSLPLMFTLVKKRQLSLFRLIDAMCVLPAKIFGIRNEIGVLKGTIDIGADADFVVLNPKKKWKIRGEKLHGKTSFTPFEGYNVVGKPIFTFVRGEIVFEDGEIVGKPGHGRFIPRSP